MAYGEKYFGEFGDFYGRLVRISILERNYTGDSSEMMMQGAAIEYNGSDTDLLVNVISSSLNVRVISQTNFQYIDLYSADAKKYQVIVTVDGSTHWRGYIVPDMFNEPYVAPPYVSQIVATDGIKIIETNEFDLTGVKNQYQIIEHCLRKIYPDLLQVYFNEGIDVFEENHDLDVSPLLQTFVDCERYKDENCYGVLTDILKLYDARIWVEDGRFWIVPARAMREGITYRKHEFLGTTDEVADNEFLVSSSRPTRMANYDQQLNILPGVRHYEIRSNLGEKGSMFKNYLFDDWTLDRYEFDVEIIDNIPYEIEKVYWILNEWSGNAIVTRNVWNNQVAQIQPAGGSVPSKYIYQQIAGKFFEGDRKIHFRLNCALAEPTGGGSGQFWIKVKLKGDNGTDYYLSSFSGVWTTSEVYLNIEGNVQWIYGTVNFEDVVFLSQNIPTTGIVHFYIYAPQSSWLLIREIEGNILLRSEEEYPEEFIYRKNINLLNNYILEDVELMTGDFPDFGNANTQDPTDDVANEQHIFYGGLFLNSSKTAVTRLWQTKKKIDDTAFAGADQLHKIVAGERMQLSIPQWAITGTIQSSEIKPSSAIVDYGISAKKYLFCNGVHDLKMCMVNGTWIENGAYSGADWILETGHWDDDGIWVDEKVWND